MIICSEQQVERFYQCKENKGWFRLKAVLEKKAKTLLTLKLESVN